MCARMCDCFTYTNTLNAVNIFYNYVYVIIGLPDIITLTQDKNGQNPGHYQF